MNPWIACFLLLSLLAMGENGRAQDVKREFETRIELSEMPPEALETLHPLLRKTRKVRYYREESTEGTTYEVKGKWRRHRWSIEFFENGRLMDLEELIGWDEVPAATAARIDSVLRSQYQRYRITRLQLQLSAPDSNLNDRAVVEAVIDREMAALYRRYEIEAEVKGPDTLGEFEFLFDATGQLLHQRPIQRRPLDHVLY
jgi:hypothetical protein